MKVTYDKPKAEQKYKLGDEFTDGTRTGKLIQISYNKIALLITNGGDTDCVWTWGTQVVDVSKLTESEVTEALGRSVKFEPVNKREQKFPKITLELESLDELKILWGRLNHNGSELEKSIERNGITEDHLMKYTMWDKLDDVVDELRLKDVVGKFKE